MSRSSFLTHDSVTYRSHTKPRIHALFYSRAYTCHPGTVPTLRLIRYINQPPARGHVVRCSLRCSTSSFCLFRCCRTIYTSYISCQFPLVSLTRGSCSWQLHELHAVSLLCFAHELCISPYDSHWPVAVGAASCICVRITSVSRACARSAFCPALETAVSGCGRLI